MKGFIKELTIGLMVVGTLASLAAYALLPFAALAFFIGNI